MEPTDRYGVLLLLIIGSLVLSPFFSDGSVQRVAMVLTASLVVLVSFRSTGVRNWRRLVVAVALVVAMTVPAALTNGAVIEVAVVSALAVAMASGPPNLVRRIFEHEKITGQLIVAALCAYLQAGFAFAFAFAAIDTATEHSFFTQGPVGGFFDYVYFSFVSMTTVGYGDLSAATDMGRALVILETLLGQVFLVVLVAYLVGRLGGNPVSRSQRRDS